MFVLDNVRMYEHDGDMTNANPVVTALPATYLVLAVSSGLHFRAERVSRAEAYELARQKIARGYVVAVKAPGSWAMPVGSGR